MKLGSYMTCTDCAALVRRYRRGQSPALYCPSWLSDPRCRSGWHVSASGDGAGGQPCPQALQEALMPRYVATVSGAGVHAIKDMEQGDTVCLFMLKRGGSFEQLRDNLNTCLRALNYVDEQRKEKKHGLASDSPR